MKKISQKKKDECVRKLMDHRYSKDEAFLLTENMLGKIDFYDDRTELNVDDVVDTCLEFELLMNDMNGWLSPDGEFFGCKYAAHHVLNYYFDFCHNELERKGWLHIGFGIADLVYFRPTAKQISAMKKFGIVYERDEARKLSSLGEAV